MTSERARDLRPTASGERRAADGQTEPANTFAVVVGIDRYPGFGDLQGACNDARAFHEWVVSPTGGRVPETSARLRLSAEARTIKEASPLKQQVDRDLYELVTEARRLPDPSRLYLYFAGHGVAPRQSTAAGVMANAVPTRCWNLSFTTYLTWFERCADFAQVVLLSDCCRTRREAAAGAPQHDACTPHVRPGQSRLVAHATDVDQGAFESEVGGGDVRGFFTSALLDGLGGAAADPVTQEVTAAGLARFLEVEVRRRSGGRQYPSIGGTLAPLVLVHRPPAVPSGTEVLVDLVPGPERTVQIVDGSLAEVASVLTRGPTIAVRLRNGLYELHDALAGEPVGFRVQGSPLRVATRAS